MTGAEDTRPVARHADVRDEALDLVQRAAARGVTLRITGGVAVAIRCPSASRPPLQRAYKDVDLVGSSAQRSQIDALMKDLGFSASEEFNSLHGHHQLLYADSSQRILDIFIDRIVMCHSLDVSERLGLDELTLTPADLLLTKLQVVQTGANDFKDSVALLIDCDIDGDRVAKVLASDWGWWRTATEVLAKVKGYGASLQGLEGIERLAARVAELETQIAAEPKGMRWKARARIGDRVSWYQLPDDG